MSGRPDDGHRYRGEGPGPQAVGMDHVGPPGAEQAAQPRDRPQVAGHARALADADRGESDAARGNRSEAEVTIGLRRAEHLGSHAAGRASGREHPDVPSGAAGTGA